MHSVADLVSEEHLKQLATPANFRLGKDLTAHVELLEFGPLKVVAKVRGGDTRTVTLLSDEKELVYACSCLGKRHFFCKHCVAVAMKTGEKSSALASNS